VKISDIFLIRNHSNDQTLFRENENVQHIKIKFETLFEIETTGTLIFACSEFLQKKYVNHEIHTFSVT
jgi:hypothetical protein